MYSDRMEIVNKGGLYGRISVDLLGKVHPETRNPALVDMMEVMGTTENRYSGIPTMRREMQAFGLPPPEFVNRNGEFRVILRNGLGAVVADSSRTAGAGQGDGSSVELTERDRRLLEFCSEPRTRAEVVDCLGVSHYYAFSKIIPKLVNAGLLCLSRPEAPRSRLQRFTSAHKP
jgi:ATP-dependent DNA helicase RecG